MMRALARFTRDQRGAAAAEMVLILPLALALMFTMFEGAYYMICEHRVVKGVRDAARYAARLDLINYACPGASFSGNAGAIKNLARTGALTGGTANVPGWVDADVSVTVTCSSGQGGIYVSNGGYAPKVSVSTRVAYPSLMSTLGFTQSALLIGASAQSPVIGI